MKIANCFVKSIWPSLLLFPMANMGLFFLFFMQGSVNNNIALTAIGEEILLLLFVAVAEELFFRGLLIRELVFRYKWRPSLAAGLVSLVFGGLHIVNAFSYATLLYAVVQGICAFALGFDLAAIYCKFRSVLPCVVIHALINITSIGLDNGARLVLTNTEAFVFLTVAILYFLHGYKVFKSIDFMDSKGEVV